MKRKINLFVEGLGCDTLKLLSSSVITRKNAILIPERLILNACKQLLSLLMADLPREMKKPLDLSKGALIDPAAWPKKYNDVMERLTSEENQQRMSIEMEI